MVKFIKNNKLPITMGIILLLLLFLGLYYLPSKNPIKKDSMITYRMYDADGKLVSNNPLSIVNGIPGVYYIDISTRITNTGSRALTCIPKTITPSAFNTAMLPLTNKSLLVGGQASWTSGLISVAPFEGAVATNFTINISCSYVSGTTTYTLPQQKGLLSLLIAPEIGGEGFSVSVSSGGLGSEYCGDTTCNSGETSETCPEDCATSSYIRFRTSDTQYVSGQAIAYNTTQACGTGTLTGYGYSAATGLLTGTCATGSKTWCGTSVIQLISIPGGWLSGGAGPSLWIPLGSSTTLCVCDDDGTKYTLKKYLTSDPDASLVDRNSSVVSFDPNKEVAC